MPQQGAVGVDGHGPLRDRAGPIGHATEPAAGADRGPRHDSSPEKDPRPRRHLAVPLAALAIAAIPTALATIRPIADFRASDPRELKPLVDVHEFMEHVVEGTFATVKEGLRDRPADAKAWRNVHDASLLLGECGNLLLIRKPDGADSADWCRLSTALRESGDLLAKATKSKEYDASRKALLALVESCNQCHVKYGDDGEPKIEP